jgi:phenylpropionate dioxygenase-like ring-hydroxylating dioxygenase large terminal subunit
MKQPDFAALRRPLEEASHAPGWLYSSPDVYRLEVERLFMRRWLFVGREEELPHPGDYFTLRVAGEPIVIARDADGVLRAFRNMCVHRGVEVAQGCGNARVLQCPYHGWTYDLSGRLTGAGYMKDSTGFERDRSGFRAARSARRRLGTRLCLPASRSVPAGQSNRAGSRV